MVALQEKAMEEMIPVVSGFVFKRMCTLYNVVLSLILSRQPHLEEEAMVVEQEETKEEDDITHQPSQEEEIPRDLQQGVQMYDSVILDPNNRKFIQFQTCR